jgi:hypothetical protein
MKAKFAAALIVVSTIGRKHGNTLIRTLRRIYGAHFAEGCRDDEKLRDVLHKMDQPSISKLLHDHERGKLDEICRPGKKHTRMAAKRATTPSHAADERPSPEWRSSSISAGPPRRPDSGTLADRCPQKSQLILTSSNDLCARQWKNRENVK